MTMHLCGPALSLNGKKKGKFKYRNAEEARLARELDSSWKDLLKRQGVAAEEKKRRRALAAEPLVYNLTGVTDRAGTAHIPSRDTGGGVAALAPAKVYTGTELIGIGQLHKSNGIPIFRKQDAEDLARMRRG
jgi:hypothetical protein